MKKRKICIITGSRAEWGLFYPLVKEIEKNRKLFILQLITTGSHLSSEFGLTYKEIEKDGFQINRKVKILSKADTEAAIAESVSLGIVRLSRALKQLKPDLVFLLGDRFEIFSAAAACLFLKIPIAHIHGGELTKGSLDDSMRHAISKMAYLHFTTTDTYRRRVIQMGESPKRVFNVGALGLDNIKNEKLLNKICFERTTKFKLGKKNIMVTFHPATSEEQKVNESQFKNLLKVLDELKDVKIILTKPNPDINSNIIIRLIDNYIAKNRTKAVAFSSMGRVVYLSSLQFMDVVTGNSSSGIIEVPSFGIPTINIGKRQEGRLRSASVIDVVGSILSIRRGFKKAFSADFKRACRRFKNPYGDGRTSKRIIPIIRQQHFPLQAKTFWDIKP